MKIKDLIKELRKYPPGTEVVFHDGPIGRGIDYTKIEILKGHLVCDENGFRSLKEGHGYFVNDKFAKAKQEDGKSLLDLTSKTIYPAISFKENKSF